MSDVEGAVGSDRDGAGGPDGVDGAHWWDKWEDTGRGAKRKRAQERAPDEEEAAWQKQLEQQPLQASGQPAHGQLVRPCRSHASACLLCACGG